MVKQPPAKRQTPKRETLDDIFGPSPAAAQTETLDEIFGAEPPTEQKKAPSFRDLVGRAGEVATDVLVGGLQNIPGAATVYGALTAARTGGQTSIREGAQAFQEMVRQAPERSGQALAGPLSPAAVAMGAVPYIIGGPAAQATRLGRALYSAGVGAARSGERAAIAEEAPADIAKAATIGAGLEAGTGFLVGEPLGAIARAMRTPTRATQVKAQEAATRAAEKPLYEAWTGYTGRGQPVTSAPLSPPTPILAQALDEPVIRRAIRVVQQNPDFRKLPTTSPVVLDRAYKIIGKAAFQNKYSVPTETAQTARDLLREGMDEAAPDFPYSDVLRVARGGRQMEEAVKRGAETARIASRSTPGTLATALKSGEESFADFLARATPEQRTAAAEAVYGYLREAPKTAGIPLGVRTRIPLPFPSRAAFQAPRIAQMAGSQPTRLQRGVRGAAAGVPSTLQSVLGQFFMGEE